MTRARPAAAPFDRRQAGSPQTLIDQFELQLEAAGDDVLMARGLPDLDAGPRRLCRGDEAGKLHGRNSRQIIHGEGTDRRRREAHQLGVVVVPRGDDRRDGGGDRGEGPRYFHIPRSRDADAGVESVHAGIGQPTFIESLRTSPSWLLRPERRRYCNVRCWHKADVAIALSNVCF